MQPARSAQSIRLGGPRKEATVTGWRPSSGSRAASFQISVTCLCSLLGCRCSDPWRTAAMKPSHDLIVDLTGLDPVGARIAGEAGQADMGAPT